MILLRQDNYVQTDVKVDTNQQRNAFKQNKYCQHQKDVNHMAIYPCCYELACIECFQNDLGQNKHECSISRDEFSNSLNTLVNLSRTSGSHLKKQKLDWNVTKNYNFNVISCSVCQKSSNSFRKIDFFNCRNCKTNFCEKCHSIVHGKGKYMAHQVNIIEKNEQSEELNQIIKCTKHDKIRKCLMKNKIGCQACFKECTGKFFNDKNEMDLKMVEQNVKFSTQYYNETYHNEANKVSQAKQNLTKIYQQCLDRLQERYRWNMNQLERTQAALKKTFNNNLGQLGKVSSQISLIAQNQNSLIEIISKDILDARIQLIQQKLFQIQNKCQDFISEMNFQYKIGDKDRQQSMIQQFLKCLNVTKVKRLQDDSIHTNRSTYRNNLKTSRTTSRPSSNRLTNSKENRCYSSFKKNQLSSNKQNSSFKQKNNFIKNDSNKKIDDSANYSIKKNIINRSISNRVNSNKQLTAPKNNLNFFKDKQINLNDIKNLQKAEYQDLNLNLKKLITNRKPNEALNNFSLIQRVSERPSQNTSLQKMNSQAQNALKKQFLTKENQKSTINSGSFLKIFDASKSKVSARKNYLLSSGQDLSENRSHSKLHKSRIQILTSNLKCGSPQNPSQLKKRNIKHQLYGSNPSSNNNFSEVQTYSRFHESSSPPQKVSRHKKDPLSGKSQENPSLMFEKLVAVSCQKQSPKTDSQLNSKDPNETSLEVKNQIQLLRSQISQFSTLLTIKSEQKHTQEVMRNVQMTSSIQVCQFNDKETSNIKKIKTKTPSTSKALTNKQLNNNKAISTTSTLNDEGKSISNPLKVLKDSSNVMKLSQKNQQKTTMNAQNDKLKRKPDFMDMREKMRKPNYLSTRFGGNISHVVNNGKTAQTKK